jgi:hypothetical protein
VARALPPALGGYLYHASRAGMGAYRDAAKLAVRSGYAGLALRPRNLVRALASSLV